MSVKETIATLEQKNKALSNQLDKITADLFKMQDTAGELKNKLDEKKHSEQLCGWAFDRATEAAKLIEKKPANIQTIAADAEKILEWVSKTSTPKETIQ